MAAQIIIRTTYISYKISSREARHIKGIVDKNPRTTAVEIRNTLERGTNVIVHSDTVRSVLRKKTIEKDDWNLPKSI